MTAVFTGQSPAAASHGSVRLILAIITMLDLLLYRASIRVLERKGMRNAEMSLD